jgi:hypothetical protein
LLALSKEKSFLSIDSAFGAFLHFVSYIRAIGTVVRNNTIPIAIGLQ